jgi:hypothetical protein
MDAMMELSETANIFFDTHRGHQYTEIGKDRRKACDLIRKLTWDFYDRLDIQTGGEGFGNIAKFTRKARSIEEKDALHAQEQMQELASHYKKWKKHFAHKEGMERTKIRDKERLFEAYASAIDIYRNAFRINSWPKEIDEVIREADYYRMQNKLIKGFESKHGEMADPVETLAQKHVAIIGNREKPEEELSEKEMDKGLTASQLKAVEEVDQWFLRNYSNAGWVGRLVGVRNHHGFFVSSLFRKTKRERLFIYYLIESDARKDPRTIDACKSQSYTPNVDKVKKMMMATRFKLISHATGAYVYMRKLDEALQINADFKNVLRECVKAESEGEKQEELTEEKRNELMQKPEKYRKVMLTKALQSAREYKVQEEKIKGLQGKVPKEEKDALEKKKSVFEKDIEELLKADDAVGEAYNLGNTNVEDLNTHKGAAAGLTGFVLETGVPFAWKIKENSPLFGKLKVGSGAISGVDTMITTLYGLYNLTQNGGKMSATDLATEITTLLKSTMSMAEKVSGSVDVVSQMGTLSDSMQYSASKTTKVFKAFSGALDTLINGYKAVVGHSQGKKADSAAEYMKDRHFEQYMKQLKSTKEDGSEKTEEDLKKEEKEYKKIMHEKNMVSLSRQLAKRKKKYAIANTVASSVKTVGTFVPGLGTILAGAGSAAGFVTSFLESMDLTAIQQKMFDNYFRFGEFMKDVEDAMDEKNRKIRDMDAYKDQMRRLLAAQAGYADLESACGHIAKQYATEIYLGLFGNEEERVQGNMRSSYLDLIHSFSLPYDEKKKLPTVEQLAKKMRGK